MAEQELESPIQEYHSDEKCDFVPNFDTTKFYDEEIPIEKPGDVSQPVFDVSIRYISTAKDAIRLMKSDSGAAFYDALVKLKDKVLPTPLKSVMAISAALTHERATTGLNDAQFELLLDCKDYLNGFLDYVKQRMMDATSEVIFLLGEMEQGSKIIDLDDIDDALEA